MKIVVMTTAGSVGKTLLTCNLLAPRIPGAKVVGVDTTNDTPKDFGLEAEEYSSEEFNKVYGDLVLHDNLIVDVGGSKEGRQFIEEMDWAQGHDEVDYFLIPAKPNTKDQDCADETIKMLLAQGVDKKKIKVVFTDVISDTAEEFDQLLGDLVTRGIDFSLDATVFRNKVYNILMGHKRTVESMLADKTDYKAAFKAAGGQGPALDLMYAQKTVGKLKENLDVVFSALFPQKTGKQVVKTALADKE